MARRLSRARGRARGGPAVFSRTLQATDWSGTTIVSGDIAIEVGKLRQLTVYPYVAATGPALFSGLICPRQHELVSSVPFATGILALTYRRRRPRSDALPLAMI